jgi:hypothetical protein
MWPIDFWPSNRTAGIVTSLSAYSILSKSIMFVKNGLLYQLTMVGINVSVAYKPPLYQFVPMP